MALTQAQAAYFARAARVALDRREAERLEGSFYEFVKAAWPNFDPAEFSENWHLEDVCEHLEAVARGHIPRLLINVPPRTGKTALVSVCFVAWVWAQRERGPLMGPQVSFYYASYAEQLSLEHSLKCRRLIESRWYQRLWGNRFKLVSDRNTKGHFENDKGGYRMASSVDARATGFGADVLCLPPGENVLTDVGWMPIDDIVLNRRPLKVAGYDHEQKSLIWQDILAYEHNPGREIIEVRFDGGSFRCTADHPVFVEGKGYVPAGQIEAGAVLQALREETELEKAIVRSVERAGYAESTFNLNVGPCHNYFVGGALVHNCADDPHLVKEAESDIVREGVVRWWTETMPSRMNDRRTGAMIVVMQRVHGADLSGYILDEKNGLEYVHVCMPMSYMPCFHINAWVGDHIETVIGQDECAAIAEEDIFWQDQRSEEGELLWSERYPVREVAKIEKEVGPYAFAGQYQQEPAPRGGGIIREEWWQPYNDEVGAEVGAKPGEYPPCEFILASFDGAYTEKEENDPSALSIWGVWRDKAGNPQIILMLCWAERLKIHELVVRVGADCKRFHVDRLIIEDKASGHSVAQELARLFGNFDFGIELVDPRTGFIKSPDKVARGLTVVHLFAEGLIWAPVEKAWALEMIKQCALVPRAPHDDLYDSMTQALIYLRRSGWAQRKDERTIELEDEVRYRPQATALYGGF